MMSWVSSFSTRNSSDMRTLLLSDSNKRVKDVLYGALIIIEGAASCRIEFVFESWVSG